MLQIPFDEIEHTTGLFQKIYFYGNYGKMFFFMDSLPKITVHVLSVPLNLEYVIILS